MICRRCSVEKEPSKRDAHLCEDCVKAENSRVSYYRQRNYNWIDVAKEADLEIWERQPEETDREYQVWLAYRDAYPSVRPSYRLVAETLGTTINVVSKVAQRWDFPVRLQAWAKHVDAMLLKKREQEILDMNQTHISMAERLNQKLSIAIDKIDPNLLTPKEVQGLMRVATDLERKARLTDVPKAPTVLDDKNPDLRDVEVPTDSLSEVLKILGAAGVLQNVGVRQTVTTEVVVKDGEQ